MLPDVVIPGVGLLTRFDVSTSSAGGHGLVDGGHTVRLHIGGLDVALFGIFFGVAPELLAACGMYT